VTVDETLPVRIEIRKIEGRIASVERDHAELRRAMEPADARAARLKTAALERAVAAQAKFEPFKHLFAGHLREQVMWMAAATNQELDSALMPSLIAAALGDPLWKTLMADARAALKELDK
jgi:hypothetical protein